MVKIGNHSLMKNLMSLSVPIGLVLCGAGFTSLMVGKPSDDKEAKIDSSHMDADATYYVFVSEIEAFDKAMDGSKKEDWDDDDDAPDLFYTIEFQGKKVFKSPQRDNTFIGNWRGITLPIALKDLTSVIKGDINLGIDFEQIINAARVKGDSTFTIKMFDHDSLTPTDKVGKLELSLANLKEGSNAIINQVRKEDSGWKRIEVKVVKREGSVKDYLLPLLREMTNEQAKK